MTSPASVSKALRALGVPGDKADARAGCVPDDGTDVRGIDQRIIAACATLGVRYRSFSLKKKTTVTALPDFRIYLGTGCAWFEAKARGDKLTRGQAAFLTDEYEAGQLVACGEVIELVAVVRAVQRGEASTARDIGWATVQRVVARGYREER